MCHYIVLVFWLEYHLAEQPLWYLGFYFSFTIASLSTSTREISDEYLNHFLFLKMLGCLLYVFMTSIDGSVSFHISYRALLSLPILSVSIMFLKYALKVSAIFLSSDKISLSSTSVMLEFAKCFLQWIIEINCFRKQHAISCAIVSLSL